MKTKTLYLKLALLAMAAIIALICIVFLPNVYRNMVEVIPHFGIGIPIFVGSIYVTAVLFYAILFQALKLVLLIDQNEAFTPKSARALKGIKIPATLIGILYALNSSGFYQITQVTDAPGIMLFGLILAGAAWMIAVFAAILQKLLEQAMLIKTENELTV